MTADGINLPSKMAIKRTKKAAHILAGQSQPFDEYSAFLPWRRERTPYRIFLAEFLLARTRFDSVARLFEQVVEQYPSISALAEADEIELAQTLLPLGLPQRVPYLIKAACFLMQYHEGKIPSSVAELRAIPGIGVYAAAAIAAFAYHSPEVPGDVNILRFLARLNKLPMINPTKGSKVLWALLPLLSPNERGPHSEVLLDFCRVVCRPNHPRCVQCPVQAHCLTGKQLPGIPSTPVTS